MPAVLKQNEVHVWVTDCDRSRPADLRKRYSSILSAKEREKLDRFVFEQDRHAYLVAHAMLRSVLARYLQQAAADVTFVYSEHGKPSLDLSPEMPPIRFNLSGTRRLAAIAVTLHHEIGVDVEHRKRDVDLAVAESYFAPHERAQLATASPPMKRQIFLRFWTLKEAYVKARGQGLSIPLNAFAYTLRDPLPPAISFESTLPDTPDQWQFYQQTVTADHWLAVAVQRPPNPPSHFSVHEATP